LGARKWVVVVRAACKRSTKSARCRVGEHKVSDRKTVITDNNQDTIYDIYESAVAGRSRESCVIRGNQGWKTTAQGTSHCNQFQLCALAVGSPSTICCCCLFSPWLCFLPSHLVTLFYHSIGTVEAADQRRQEQLDKTNSDVADKLLSEPGRNQRQKELYPATVA